VGVELNTTHSVIENGVGNRKLQHFLPNVNTPAAISNGKQEIKLCCKKIFQFLPGDAS